MKKFLILILCLVFAFNVFGCGGDNNTQQQPDQNNGNQIVKPNADVTSPFDNKNDNQSSDQQGSTENDNQSSGQTQSNIEFVDAGNIVLQINDTFNLKEYYVQLDRTITNVSVVDNDVITYKDGIITANGVGENDILVSVKAQKYENAKTESREITRVYQYKVQVKENAITDYQINRGYFYGKKVVFYGDSISAKVGVESNANDYIDNMKETLGFTFDRYSQGGALYNAWTAKGYNRESCCNLVISHPEQNKNADYAVLFFGTNDFGRRAKIGELLDSPTFLTQDASGYIADTDVKSVTGSIRFSVNKLREENPNLKILILSPLIRNDTPLTNNQGKTLLEYVQAIMDTASILNCRTINMYELFSQVELTVGAGYTSDDLHPNSAGHKKISNYILNYDTRR